MKARKVGWGYGQRYLLELAFVVGIWGFLTYIAAIVFPSYMSNAYLAEPVHFAKSFQSHLAIDFAFSGRWSNEETELPYDVDYSKGIKDVFVDRNGNIDISLQYPTIGIDSHNLAFNLGLYNAGHGYQFSSWYCGENRPPTEFVIKNRIESSVDPMYSHTICRK